ncbi:MAG TPA: YfhO family protein, partial [Candidatus Sulfotelmatobacter sp.]|nr:YfhO family protein [Candidatus Sulfotelmatobacter sp.]
VGVSALAWLIFSSSRETFINYLQEVQIDPGTAQAVAKFSVGQLGWFILFLVVAVGLMTLILSGKFTGPRARWGAVLLGLFLAVDLGRANQPWIVTWNYEQKYASNPVIDLLRDKPYEHRVAILPFRAPAELELINQLYRIEWAQHHFLYYNVQSLDLVQMPRMPEDLMAFETAFQPRNTEDAPRLMTRRWQLTNTRYLLGAAGFLEVLNQQLDPGQHRFRIAERFQIVPKPGIDRPTKLEELTAVPATNGNYALFEFTGALPRARLYTNWQVKTNDQATLEQLPSAAFNPEKSVLVANPIPAPATSAATNQDDGSVEFTSYAPKDIVFKANAAAPSVLLLNDRYDSNWKVFVDGKPETLLRCNYLMRGVYLTPGSHKVEFRFQPPMDAFYVSLSAVGLAVLLCGLLLVVKGPSESEPAASEPTSKSPSAPKAAESSRK